MEYCVQCGNALSSEAKFCPKCGAPVKRELYTAPRPKRGITSPSPIRENPVLTCRRASKKQKNRWLIVMAGSAFFTLLSVIMVCVTYEPESFICRARINWPMIIIGIFFFVDAVIYGIMFMQADKYHVEIFEEHFQGLSLCLTGGIREINVPYTQVQGVTVAEKQCALVLQLAGRQETMYCPDVETTKQMGQYINGRIRASCR